MRRTTIGALLGLLIGCAAGVGARSMVAPDARAQWQGAVFQYACTNTTDTWSANEVQGFNRLGQQGWELTTMTGHDMGVYQACFKRRVR